MIKTLNLIQEGDKFVNNLELPIYEGETLDLRFEVDFDYMKANVKVNNLFVGSINGRQVGIHASKLKLGENEVSIYFFDDHNQLIKTLAFTFVRRVSCRGTTNLEEEFSKLYAELSLLKKRLVGIEEWREEIDNERSGF